MGKKKGPFHIDLGGGGHITSKHKENGGGVSNPKAVGFCSMKSPSGSKTSVTFYKDGSAKRQSSQKYGSFLSGLPGGKKRR